MSVCMIVWILTCFAFLAVPLGLLVLGRLAIPRGQAAQAAGHRPAWPMRHPPKAALIIPMTGTSPHMEPALRSLLAQDYPNHDVVLTTQDAADPATALALQLTATHAHARHVLAGEATRCGQKTHNQLAALATLAPDVSLLAFCDASHLAQPNFLSCLLEPLLRGQGRVATGYHLCQLEDARLGTLGQGLVVLALHALQACPGLRQPWGGAMAMTRKAFDELQVAELWGTNVVDDVSLAGRLAALGEAPAFAPAACLLTRLSQSPTGWSDWLTRQLAYPRFIMPGTWLGIGLGLVLLTGIQLAALACALGWLAGLTAAAWGAPALGMLLLLTALLLALGRLLPMRPPSLRWIAIGLLALPMACWCYARSASSRVMRWRHRAYVIGKGGRVERIIEE